MFDTLELPATGIAPAPSVRDALEWPDATAAEMASALPGPETAAPLVALDAGTLSPAGRVDALVAVERQIAWLQARQQHLLAEMARDCAAARRLDAEDAPGAGRARGRLAAGWVREDVACALRLSAVTAQRRLAVAQTLVERLPATLRRLESGEICYLQAMHLAEATYPLDAEAAAAVETRVLRRAGEQTVSECKRSIRRAVARVDAAGVERKRAEAMTERRVCVTPREDGMAELWSLLPAEGAAAVLAAVDALASITSADDPRCADERRADALVDLAVSALHDPLLPKAQGLRPAVQITVPLSTLLGCDEQPGELAGHGPIPASVARRIAADPTGTWRRLVTDPLTGALLDYGRSTYRPPADLAGFVIARDQVCLFSTCNRAAQRCELDHRIPFSEGGTTGRENVGPLCKRHHIAKHEAGWQLGRHPDGTYIWTAPTGHRYRSRPPDLPNGTAINDEPPPF